MFVARKPERRPLGNVGRCCGESQRKVIS